MAKFAALLRSSPALNEFIDGARVTSEERKVVSLRATAPLLDVKPYLMALLEDGNADSVIRVTGTLWRLHCRFHPYSAAHNNYGPETAGVEIVVGEWEVVGLDNSQTGETFGTLHDT